MRILPLVATVSYIALPGYAYAEGILFEAPHPAFGDGAITIDTSTGLSWIDISVSRDYSFTEAELAMRPGGRFEGFRHASAKEVSMLFESAGLTKVFVPEADPAFQNAVRFLTLLGGDTEPEYGRGIMGIGGLDQAGDAVVPFVSYGDFNGEFGYWISNGVRETGTLAYAVNTHFSTVGNWMVIPEPSSIYLVLAGIGLLIQKQGTELASLRRQQVAGGHCIA